MFFHELGELLLVFVADFNNDTGILGKQGLHHVAIGTEVVQVDVHTALGIGKAHFQQRGNQTTGGDVVTSHYPALLNELLNGHEGVGKVFGILNSRNIAAHLAKTLGKGRTAETLLVQREIDVVKRSVLVVDNNGRNNLADV